MEKLSLFKRIKLFQEYWKLLKRNKNFLTDKRNGLNLRIDRAGRIYTVYTCPDGVKEYGMELGQKYIREYINSVEPKFIEIGLIEYVGLMNIEQLPGDGLDFLIVFGFKGFQSNIFLRNLILLSIGITISLSVFLYYFI